MIDRLQHCSKEPVWIIFMSRFGFTRTSTVCQTTATGSLSFHFKRYIFMQLKCTFWCFRWEVTGMFALLTQLEGLFVNKNYHLFFPNSPPNLLFFALLPFHPPLPLSLLFPCFWPSITSLLHPSHLQPRGVMKLRWPLQGEYDKLWNHECANDRKPKYGGGGGLPGDGPA